MASVASLRLPRDINPKTMDITRAFSDAGMLPDSTKQALGLSRLMTCDTAASRTLDLDTSVSGFALDSLPPSLV